MAIKLWLALRGPFGLALLEEGAHTLLALGSHPQLSDALHGVSLDVLDAAPGHLSDQRPEIGILHVEWQLPGLDAAEVEKIDDQPVQLLGALVGIADALVDAIIYVFVAELAQSTQRNLMV